MENHYNNHIYTKQNVPKAKNLRYDMTEQEKKLWYKFLKGYSVRFYRQRTVDNYILDFYCAKAKLAVELDGSQHYSDKGLEYDENRTKVLEKYHIKVIRFTNMQVIYNFREVCKAIDEEVSVRLGETPQSRQAATAIHSAAKLTDVCHRVPTAMPPSGQT